MTDNNPLQLESMELGGVNTNIIYSKGTNPEMPMVFYHPGIFGQLENLTNIPRIALETGCSFLALNTIDQDPDGTYPPRNIDFNVCMKIIEDGLKQHDTSKGIIPILNSWGSFPITLALQRQPDITVKGVLGVGATLNAHLELEAGLGQYFQHRILSQKAKEAFEAGKTISNIPYPPPPNSDMEVSINKSFFESHKGLISTDQPIHVEKQIILIRAQNDEHVNDGDTNGITCVYQNSVEADRRSADGGHWDSKEAEVESALKEIIHSCHPKLAA